MREKTDLNKQIRTRPLFCSVVAIGRNFLHSLSPSLLQSVVCGCDARLSLISLHYTIIIVITHLTRAYVCVRAHFLLHFLFVWHFQIQEVSQNVCMCRISRSDSETQICVQCSA